VPIHEDEAIGKAYDARLMRRLLEYLRPYRWQVAVALAALVGASALQLTQPYLVKLAIDRYIASRDLAGLDRVALAYVAVLAGAFGFEYLQTYIMQMTGQRINVRPADAHLRPPASGSTWRSTTATRSAGS